MRAVSLLIVVVSRLSRGLSSDLAYTSLKGMARAPGSLACSGDFVFVAMMGRDGSDKMRSESCGQSRVFAVKGMA